MEQIKKDAFEVIEGMKNKMTDMSDYIHDNPELGNHEFKASKLLTETLKEAGFNVETGICKLPTAFRATYTHLKGGPTIGFLCEYDALENLGHGCAHNMQGPSILGAAISISKVINSLNEYPAKIVVIGTPAEETVGTKVQMAKEGAFDDLDVALMMHGSDRTTVDKKALAMNSFEFIFRGRSAHAAIAPQEAIDALDGVLLTFNGIEYLREHVKDDVRIHGIINNGGKAANVIPDMASALFDIRSEDRGYLNEVIERVKNVAKGAALATGNRVEIVETGSFDNKIALESLSKLIIENAKLAGTPNITPPREKTGSTDFGNVTYRIPGACLRVAFMPLGVSSHTIDWVKAGKSEEAHNAVITGAEALAGTGIDLITEPSLLKEIKDEFNKKRNIK